LFAYFGCKIKPFCELIDILNKIKCQLCTIFKGLNFKNAEAKQKTRAFCLIDDLKNCHQSIFSTFCTIINQFMPSKGL